MAIRMKRRAIGIELKDTYYQQSVLNCKKAMQEGSLYIDDKEQIGGQTSLFD
jgi:hypothetical protein